VFFFICGTAGTTSLVQAAAKQIRQQMLEEALRRRKLISFASFHLMALTALFRKLQALPQYNTSRTTGR
jgi:hypothetical protein